MVQNKETTSLAQRRKPVFLPPRSRNIIQFIRKIFLLIKIRYIFFVFMGVYIHFMPLQTRLFFTTLIFYAGMK